ncbi:acetate/propionate family kinase [Acinetobacter gerneri]|uniref:Acetate kinase n=2 Tax=Acinetobacter gerneri TaxID=202952 RepID=N8ZN60_9GAMM|nr:acetate kinase [Acinetobacter gerneri]ENV35184.1 acetate kinase [Acinetobacter gerneri DSM 14967 = CIP 107464 = MTCC 9824]EPR83427.1 Acetate kinase [Acinetobacter gerneri DSM 14967 = CIP 107464 = MTCC 9824]MCH4243879.1 acetate kinase [Acinetobacter gerneri]MDQ9008809.1 acetate kinase [Acinetobacter gerneri]MDQ9012913.1 acetate kinase [Acinetobacter gerneri]
MSTSVLVINCGSSSIKYALVSERREDRIFGLAENLGSADARIKGITTGGQPLELSIPHADHEKALETILGRLAHHKPKAIGHRVVHGGTLTKAELLTPEIVERIREATPLAPLHNPAHLVGIDATMRLFPELPQVAVFDTAFHQTMPAHAYRYALPKFLYTEHNVRRYGFHGTSHAYVSERGSELAGSYKQGGWLTAHLGNGSSTCAIWNGQSVDTSMGLTPLEGVVMGTRSGDVDPSIHSFLASNLGWDIYKIDKMLNSQSGLLGLSDLSNDMRTLIEASEQGNDDATLAIEVFCYRLAKSLAALSCGLPRIDGLFFTGGIGENSAYIREKTLAYLPHFGFNLSLEANNELKRGTEGRIDSGVGPQIWVVPTDEEGRIAKETEHVVDQEASAHTKKSEDDAALA